MDSSGGDRLRLSMRDTGWILLMAGITLAATYYLGWQQQLGRADPAFLLPWLFLANIPLVHMGRRQPARRLMVRLALLLAMLLAGQGALCAILSPASGWALVGPHFLVLLLGGAVAIGLALLILPLLRRGRLWSLGVFALLAPLFFGLSHMVLDRLYASPAVSDGAPSVVAMTSLPLRWSGGDDFGAILSGAVEDDPALSALEAMGPIELVDSISGMQLRPNTILLLLHPRAMSPDELVLVDAHVRAGGRAVVFADALSSWHARHPLGDVRNPPITSLLTPLLDHWGVQLEAVPQGRAGELVVQDDGYQLRLLSAGRFNSSSQQCMSSGDGYLMRCQIGAGEAVLIGDADALQVHLWAGEARGSRHLLKSDIFPWLKGSIWRDTARGAWLRPVWIARAS